MKISTKQNLQRVMLEVIKNFIYVFLCGIFSELLTESKFRHSETGDCKKRDFMSVVVLDLNNILYHLPYI